MQVSANTRIAFSAVHVCDLSGVVTVRLLRLFATARQEAKLSLG